MDDKPDLGSRAVVERPPSDTAGDALVAPSLDFECVLWEQGYHRIAGVDEAGLGSLCGPVVSAAVCLPTHCSMIPGVRDSKLLSASQRERLFDEIGAQALAVGVGAASVAEIERYNVLLAVRLAMKRALERIRDCDHALIDGLPIRTVDLGPHTAIVDGDARCYAIACASIVAKVTRDLLMRKLALRYPGYGWDRNAGYGTPEHLEALRRYGPTPYHRRYFAPVRAVIEQRASGRSPSLPSPWPHGGGEEMMRTGEGGPEGTPRQTG